MVGYKSVIPSASGVSVRLHSAGPSSTENKERSCGSSRHKAAIQGHQTRRQSPPRRCVLLHWSRSLLLHLMCLYLSFARQRAVIRSSTLNGVKLLVIHLAYLHGKYCLQLLELPEAIKISSAHMTVARLLFQEMIRHMNSHDEPVRMLLGPSVIVHMSNLQFLTCDECEHSRNSVNHMSAFYPQFIHTLSIIYLFHDYPGFHSCFIWSYLQFTQIFTVTGVFPPFTL